MSDNVCEFPESVDGWQTAKRSVTESLARARAQWSRIEWLPVGLVLAATIVGAALRLYDIDGLPSGFNQDEAVYSYDAYSLAQSGRDHLGHPINLIGFEAYGDWVPPMQSILLTPAAALFGLDITAFRVWNALLALTFIPIMYVVAKSLFGQSWIGVTAAWVATLLPWHVAESRWVHPSSLVPAVTALLILALARAARNRDGTWLTVAAVLAAAGLATYPSLRAYVGMLLVAAAISWWRWYLAIPLKTIALAALVFGIIAIPTYGFILLDEAGGMRMREVSVFTENSFYLPADTEVDVSFLARQYMDYFKPHFLFDDAGEYYPRVLPSGVGALPIVIAALVTIGAIGLIVALVRGVDRWQRGLALFLLIALLLYPVPGAVSVPGPASVRVIHGIPVFVLVAAYGVSWLYTVAKEKISWRTASQRRLAVGLGAVVLGLLFIVESAQDIDLYFSNYATESAADFHAGFPETVEYVLQNQVLYDEIWVAHVNEPYIYFLYLDEMDPANARERFTIIRNPNGYNWITQLDNIHFTARIWLPPPEDIPIDDMAIAFQTFYPSGEVAYEVRTGMVPNRGHVMLVYKPEWL